MTNLDWIRTLTATELSNWFYNEWLEHMQYVWSSSRGGLEYWLSKERVADTPQTDCDKLINAVVKLDMSRENKFKVIELLEQHCEKCKHYLFTDIDGYYCEHETYGQPCGYEPRGAQTDCGWAEPK